MATLLNVSRPTVREAMNQLVHEGVLQREPYRGIRVAETDDQALSDATEVRVQLETLAALRIARDGNAKALRDLDAAVHRHTDAIEAGDPMLIDSTHLDIHRCLWQESGNRMLGKIWPLVATQLQLSMTLDQVARADPARDAHLHQRLVAVISRGDEREIVAEVEAHIRFDGHRKR